MYLESVSLNWAVSFSGSTPYDDGLSALRYTRAKLKWNGLVHAAEYRNTYSLKVLMDDSFLNQSNLNTASDNFVHTVKYCLVSFKELVGPSAVPDLG